MKDDGEIGLMEYEVLGLLVSNCPRRGTGPFTIVPSRDSPGNVIVNRFPGLSRDRGLVWRQFPDLTFLQRFDTVILRAFPIRRDYLSRDR
jgi:hypothetical protein